MTVGIQKLLIAVVTMFIIPSAYATDYGRNMFSPEICGCYIAAPNTVMSANEIHQLGDTVATEVKAATAAGFQPGDTITACDGKACVDMLFTSAGWLPKTDGKTKPDSGGGYRNGQVTRKDYQNSDSGFAIGGYYIYQTIIVWQNSAQAGTVTITQKDVPSSGFGVGFQWGTANSSYAFGADLMAGGIDHYAAQFGGGGSGGGGAGGTCSNYCPPVMEK